MNLFLELRRHDKLSNKRSPFYEQSQVAQFFIYLAAAFYVCYLILFGVMFAFIMDDGAKEAYHYINSGLFIFFAIDFLMRFGFQKLPTQEIKPYILLPIKRSSLIDVLLVRSALSSYNLFWLFFFVPFAILTVTKFYGIWGVITYCFGIWLIAVANNYWFQLCKLLLGEKFWWFLLPLAFWGAIIGLAFADFDPLYNFHLEVGEGLIQGNILTFIGLLALIAALFFINRWLIGKLMYNEMNKVADTKVKHVSEYKFFDRFGEIGEYMRLELKMLTRNKVSRQQLISISVLVIVFSLLISFSDVYEGSFQDFLVIYNFVIFGTMFLSMLMSFEGNYIDGLMSRKESIYTLLRAKYYIYSVAMLIPLLFMLPAVFTGKVLFLTCLAWMVFTCGAVFCCYFQLAVYNNRTIPMNEKMTNRNYMGSGKQNIISLVVFGVPITLGLALKGILGEMWMAIIVLTVGVAFMLTSNLWIMNVYKRFMKRRYINMEGFRDSRQK